MENLGRAGGSGKMTFLLVV